MKLLIIIITILLSTNQEPIYVDKEIDSVIKNNLIGMAFAQDSLSQLVYSEYKTLGVISLPKSVYVCNSVSDERALYIFIEYQSKIGFLKLIKWEGKNQINTLDLFNMYLEKSNKDIFYSMGSDTLRKIISTLNIANKKDIQLSSLMGIKNINQIFIVEELFKTKLDYILFKSNELYGFAMIDDSIYHTKDSNNLFNIILNNGEYVIKEY